MIPREFFPNMPDEVFEMWLAPIAKEYGWPFRNSSDCIKETKWFYVLGRLTLDFWINAKWELSEIDLATVPLSYGSQLSVRSIFDRCNSGIPTLFAGVEGSEERFRACADFIRSTGQIPKPIVILIRNGQIEIIDGSHRIAALIHVDPPQGYIIPAWITSMKSE